MPQACALTLPPLGCAAAPPPSFQAACAPCFPPSARHRYSSSPQIAGTSWEPPICSEVPSRASHATSASPPASVLRHCRTIRSGMQVRALMSAAALLLAMAGGAAAAPAPGGTRQPQVQLQGRFWPGSKDGGLAGLPQVRNQPGGRLPESVRCASGCATCLLCTVQAHPPPRGGSVGSAPASTPPLCMRSTSRPSATPAAAWPTPHHLPTAPACAVDVVAFQHRRRLLGGQRQRDGGAGRQRPVLSRQVAAPAARQAGGLLSGAGGGAVTWRCCRSLVVQG